jgi:outer membrane protein OmpA-like peptidoglycan-associated protein
LGVALLAACSTPQEPPPAPPAQVAAPAPAPAPTPAPAKPAERWTPRLADLQQAIVSAGSQAAEISRTPEDALLIRAKGDRAFSSGRATLSTAIRNLLDPLATVLAANPDLEVTIVGHTDSVGSAAGNEKLSRERAEAVKAYLVSHGVPAEHIQASGRGESEPIAGNETPAGRAANRRAEIFVSEPR